MRTIAIAIIGILIVLFLVAYGPWRTGWQRAKDSTGGLNVAQDSNRPATAAGGAEQSVKDVQQSTKVKEVQQSVKEGKQRVTDTQGVKRHGKGSKRSMTGMRQGVKQKGAERELWVVETRADYGASGCVQLRCEGSGQQVVETPVAKRLTVDVWRPTEDVKGVYVEVQAQSIEPVSPVSMKYVKGSSDWAPARAIYMTVPKRQECLTPYGVRVELSVN
jgi:type II secretory pathway pseudopilin PulG